MKKFRYSEIQHLLIAWLVLGFCFSARDLFSPQYFSYPIMFGVALVTLGAGFVFHELSHKFIAQKFACRAEFRIWVWGLGLALMLSIISQGSFIFAAPGAVYITPLMRPLGWGFEISRRDHAYISLSGPLTNVALAMIFFAIANADWGILLTVIGRTGLWINLWLAAFNMLPFGPFDGQKVFSWNPAIWAGIAIPLWVMMYLVMF